ncbi:transcription cofactor vestigial-like protein 4 [Denticeps clupeoides]|uniref:Transcription cofactor vestigial-like protein 4 n=1 Tax=Denticeps clupeoides TaxID=299321 RepID=A0AAY4EM69_9TELE|nr:transcription cofactor vestigial-like protein 4 [Denticeps clupeoides]
MLLTRMDLLNQQFLDKMNNNIGRLHFEDESGLTRDSMMQKRSSATAGSRTSPPPVSPSKRKYIGEHAGEPGHLVTEHMSKMSRLFAAHLRGKPVNGDNGQDPWVSHQTHFDYPTSSISSLHGNLVYAPLTTFTMDQTLDLTKTSMDTRRTTSANLPVNGLIKLQQNRPSVITCAPASNHTCSLSLCHMSPSGCTSDAKSKANANPANDPEIEEHFRRSLGKIYKELEPTSNSVSITGSVDEHFVKALGETWFQIQAKGSGFASPESTL